MPDKTRQKNTQPKPVDVVQLELFTNRFAAIARQMGEQLQRTAVSVNVKERLDFSCAILDSNGELVVNAPHIPVHLGAIGHCVRCLHKAIRMSVDDVIVTNHPGFGGSHLPDVTVVSPVYCESGNLLGYVANRAHHAEIGGVRPGSMPPFATCLAEEGVVIAPNYLVQSSRPRWDEIRSLLSSGSYPSRAVEDNLADLRAAVAANRHGATALLKLAEAHGENTVAFYMNALKNLAAQRMRQALEKVSNGIYQAQERLDDGSLLCAQIFIQDDRATIDFQGSADTHPGNLNATTSIVHSVVIYILRLLINQPLPLNEGILEPVTLTIPRGILNPLFPDDPQKAPAVVGGNVETSQRLVNTLLKALGLVAGSQGTMNNVLFGNERFGYYETIGGGCGAGPDFDGASAVHSHMTNTRITDPEVLEQLYPVRLERFAVCPNSGGDGLHTGGDGIIREITFLEEMSLSVLTQNRNAGPYGLQGGEPGQPGRQQIIRTNGEVEILKAVDGCQVSPGDRLIIETPGGGGFGRRE